MKEIEIKVIEIDKKKVLKKLKELGAKKVGEYDIKSMIFDTPDKKFSKKMNLIRLRQKGKCYLTFKGREKNGFAKKAEEIEFEVSDFEKTKLFLEKIGFVSAETVGKHRTTFKLKETLVEIDEYPGIPAFLEIEGKTEKEIKEVLKILELPEDKVRTWNGFELFKHYGKKLSL